MSLKMHIEKYSTGDNWNEPYTSGYDNVWEMIMDDMDKRPHAYDKDEKALFEMDCSTMSQKELKRLRQYIEGWISVGDIL